MVMPAATAPMAPSPVLRTLQLAVHGLFALLLTVGTVRGAQESSRPIPLVLGCLALGAWYAIGLVTEKRRPSSGVVWFAVLFVGWIALVAVSVELSWVAFALFFIALHLLRVPVALAVIGVATLVVVTAQLARGDGPVVPRILGPCIGALVAIGIASIYRQLRTESEQRRQLNAELLAAQGDLIATHDALAGAQREAGVLQERARLAREVHDTLAQSFSSIVLLSRAGLTGTADESQLRDVLTRIEQAAADGLTDARSVVHALTPTELERAPLSAALQRLIDRQSGPTGLELVVDDQVGSLPTTVEVALLRIAQGALANVRQHADACRTVVTLGGDADVVRLDVRDDGRGFDPSAPIVPSQSGGYGLNAMRARTEETGGRFAVESAPGEGTTVQVEIPLNAARS